MTKIAVAKGDGIGPEIMDAVLSVFKAAKVPLEYEVAKILVGKGFAVEATPAALSLKSGAANFDLKAEKFDQGLQITRSFVLEANYFPTDKYWEMRDFFRRVAVGDEGQAALKRVAPSTAQAN